MSDHDWAANAARRLEALPAECLTYGPEYRRGAASAVNDARRFLAWGDKEAAELFLWRAETACGMSSWATTNITGEFVVKTGTGTLTGDPAHVLETGVRELFAAAEADWPVNDRTGVLVVIPTRCDWTPDNVGTPPEVARAVARAVGGDDLEWLVVGGTRTWPAKHAETADRQPSISFTPGQSATLRRHVVH